jgi:hypothetical protein
MSEQLQLEVESLRKEVAELRDMVLRLAAAPAPAAAAHKAEAKAEIDADTMAMISAAIAAYLGKRAKIRLVRPVPASGNGWMMQGRAAIQGSHSVR